MPYFGQARFAAISLPSFYYGTLFAWSVSAIVRPFEEVTDKKFIPLIGRYYRGYPPNL